MLTRQQAVDLCIRLFDDRLGERNAGAVPDIGQSRGCPVEHLVVLVLTLERVGLGNDAAAHLLADVPRE